MHICFLLSYYFHSTASQADTFYISVVIEGNAQIVDDNEENTDTKRANGKVSKGKYESLDAVRPVSVIKITPQVMRGKGQHWSPAYRLKTRNILSREGWKRANPRYHGNRYSGRRQFENMGRA